MRITFMLLFSSGGYCIHNVKQSERYLSAVPMTRRLTHFVLPSLILLGLAYPTMAQQKQPPIDRHALVSRHNVVLTAYNGERPLQVGNGEFAFGMDITGLQTFAPFNTMSQWGWHSAPLPAGKKV